jgi:hypothetical protein
VGRMAINVPEVGARNLSVHQPRLGWYAECLAIHALSIGGNFVSSPAHVIAERYRLHEVIGRGGMATIYRGHDLQLDRDVAVKVLHGHLGQDRTFLRRFAAEARRAASVQDEHVIAIYDVPTSDERPAIVMELAARDLSRVIAEEGSMPPARAARIAADIAGGLRAAHRMRIVHRDVKPANVLLTAGDEVRVADFGIARAAGDESLTGTGTALGSVDYFSPEQARGARATARSDIYALGVVLFELLTGERPFHGSSPYAIAIDRLHRPSPDVRALRHEVPARLAAIAQRAMAVEPSARFASSSAMRKALLDWLASPEGQAAAAAEARQNVQAAPAIQASEREIPARDAPTKRRLRLVPALLALLLLGVTGFLGGRMLEPTGWSSASMGISVGSPVAVVLPIPSPRPVPSASASPPATPSETPAPTPTIEPTPVATATVTPLATAVQVAARSVEPDPGETVAGWYALVTRGDFDASYALWSDRMRAEYPRQGNLDERWGGTASVTFNQLYIAEQTVSTAKVQVDFVETKDSGATYRYIGWWDLVLADGRWLLDHPNF